MSKEKKPQDARSEKKREHTQDVAILKGITDVMIERVKIQRDALRALDVLSEKYKDYR